MDSKFDVIVVGGGPAGSCAARRAAQLGLQVLCIEKASMPRNKACGGGIQKLGVPYFSDFKEYFDSIVTGAIFFGPQNEMVDGGDGMSGVMVIRSDFDQKLLQAAQSAGAHVKEGEKVTDISVTQNEVIVTTTKQKYSGKIVFGADGVNSIVAKRSGLKTKWDPKEVCLVMVNETEVGESKLDEFYAPKRKLIFHFGYGDTLGYGWIFPKKRHVNVGVGCVLSRVHDLKTVFQEYISMCQAEGYLPAIDPQKTTAALVPMCGPLNKVYGHRVFLLGDAGGFVSPGTGEGLPYAARSGIIASEVAAKIIQDQDFRPRRFRSYQKRCMKEFGNQLRFFRTAHSIGIKRISKFLRYCQIDSIFADLFLNTIQSSNLDRKWALLWRYFVLRIKEIFGKLPSPK